MDDEKPPMQNEINDKNSIINNSQFICGVVEGFYGRPWTTEQRKNLFSKLKSWGMNSYIYAPKDDYKHRVYWRELYTVEEADHLSGLIAAAKKENINFYYALSPGLDITYSNIKEITILKRKLEQVSQFGCEAFALLFDDIESEMSKSDKEIFQSFAHAQVSITNEVYNHLNFPKFLFCPTQYCTSRAVPNISQSEYLNTLGSKLIQNIDILWTGDKVISKKLTIESMQEITETLKRPPVIWDNLHANDYDQKRVFLGPYQGRSPELIPFLRGVVTNPNCEFHANTIAIHTLARWSKCKTDNKISNSISADIKLETENEEGICSEDVPAFLSENVYHPKLALKNAILDWLPEFREEKEAWGPISKPQPQVSMVMPIIPIIPSINTCMSLTSTSVTSTTTTSQCNVTDVNVNTTQLQAFADVCSTVSGIESPLMSTKPIMNSLVSAKKVVTNDLPNPLLTNVSIIPQKMLLSTFGGALPLMNIGNEAKESSELTVIKDILNNLNNDPGKNESDNFKQNNIYEDNTEKMNIVEDSTISNNVESESKSNPLLQNEPMECGNSNVVISPKRDAKLLLSDDVVMLETTSTCSGSMQVECSSNSSIGSNNEMSDEKISDKDMNYDDIILLCDLFYLPFEHGSKALQLLNEFYWLKTNAVVLVKNPHKKGNDITKAKPEVQEWFRRSQAFFILCQKISLLTKKLVTCSNKEICYDLYSYIWDITGVISIMIAYIKWLEMGHFPENINSFTQGSYTWFSKGWKENFMSGDQEPWVFRGGLIADLQRLIPVDSGNDLFVYKLPDVPTLNFLTIRPYSNLDESDVYQICHKTCRDGSDCTELFPDNLQSMAADRLVGPFITIDPEFCMVVENLNNTVIGYACASLDAKIFYRYQEMCWVPEMCNKYPKSLLNSSNLTQTAKDTINHFHNFKYDCPPEVLKTNPSIMTCCLLKDQMIHDQSISKRLVTVILAELRSNGSFGVHVCINRTDHNMFDFYTKLGFTEIGAEESNSRLYLGRNF